MAARVCTICGFHYASPEDSAEHLALHKRFLRATRALGYVPQDGPAQEAAKQAAWPVVRDAARPLEERVAAAEAILRAQFDRSLRNTIFNGGPRDWQRHPSFEGYVAQALWRGTSFPPEVEEILLEKYGTAPSALRGTYWTPARHVA